MSRILLVEDDDTLGYVLQSYLEMKGFEVDWTRNGAEGLAAFAKSNTATGELNYHLCIMDVMMPEMDGFTLAAKMKKQSEHFPIIFLTARALKVDKLKGFNLGADDYIVKPIDEEELVARINAVLRRTSGNFDKAKVFQIGQYTFDVKNQKLSFGKEEQYLTERETQILHLLCQHKGNLLSRKHVLQTLWGKSDYFNRRSMDVFISKLRKYLSGDASIQITNVHGSGFILSD